MDEDIGNEKLYNSFIVNRHLSYFPDTVFFAEDMNTISNIDNRMRYEYLLNSIRSQKKRFVKWFKKEKVEDLEIIIEYFGCSRQKAVEYQKILSEEQMDEIKTKLIKGGVK